jgi:HSP20 family protein
MNVLSRHMAGDATRSQLFSPFEEVFDRFFDDFFGDRRNLDRVKAVTGYPKIDIVTEGDYWIVKAAIPGVNPTDIKVEIIPQTDSSPATLRIGGQMAEEYRSPENANYSMRELHKSSFRRELHLPNFIEGEPEAKVKDGLLTLRWKHKIDQEIKPKVKVIEVKKE